MKISSVLKVLGAAAAVAALTPYEVDKDEETGRDVDITLGLNVPGRKSEAELFADDEPEAAVLDAEELQTIADEAQEAADEAQALADEAQAIADEAQAAADEAAEAVVPEA